MSMWIPDTINHPQYRRTSLPSTMREGYRVKEIEDTGRIIEWNVENVAAVGKEN